MIFDQQLYIYTLAADHYSNSVFTSVFLAFRNDLDSTVNGPGENTASKGLGVTTSGACSASETEGQATALFSKEETCRIIDNDSLRTI